MTQPLDLWVFGSALMNGHGSAGEELGRFSSHWAACAAMLRFSSPEFVSLGGDKAADLNIEKSIRQKIAQRQRQADIMDMVNRRGLVKNPQGVIGDNNT